MAVRSLLRKLPGYSLRLVNGDVEMIFTEKLKMFYDESYTASVDADLLRMC